MRNAVIVGAMITLLGVTFGLGRWSVAGAHSTSEPLSAQAPVLATWDGGAFTIADLEAELSDLGPVGRGQYREEQARAQLVEEAARTALLAHEARLRGLDQRPSFARRQRLELAALLKDAVESAPTESTAAEIENYYHEHPERFAQPETVRAAHIVLEKKADALTLLQQLQKQSATDAYAFADAAQEKSTDVQTRARSGELPEMTPAQFEQLLGPDAWAAVKDLPPNKLVPRVIETQRGFHVVRLIERRPATVAPLDSVRDTIAHHLRTEARAAAWRKLAAELDAAHGFNVDREAVRRFVVK